MTESTYNEFSRQIDVLEKMEGLLCEQIITLRRLLEAEARRKGLLVPLDTASEGGQE